MKQDKQPTITISLVITYAWPTLPGSSSVKYTLKVLDHIEAGDVKWHVSEYMEKIRTLYETKTYIKLPRVYVNAHNIQTPVTMILPYEAVKDKLCTIIWEEV